MAQTENKKSIPLYTAKYWQACAIGGLISCGTTHTMITPLDLTKCNIQANPKVFKSLGQGLRFIVQKQGVAGLYRGWAPTLFGYSIQGIGKFGLYEFFKYKYSHMVSEETAYKYRDLIYLSGAASAEFVADIGLCAFEATKVRVQTTMHPETLEPTYARGLRDGMGKIISTEGFGGLFKGLAPLWLRQIPYTMMKFFGFERAVELIYRQLPRPKESYGKGAQLAVSFGGGYLAGIFCAAVSHPADTVVSILNKDKTATIGKIMKTTPLLTLCTKGLFTRILMIGTLTAAQWCIYDAYKTHVGLPTTGGAKKTPPTKAAAPAPKSVEAPKPITAPVLKVEAVKPAEKPVEKKH
eukprot:TRINITY_DN728_c0_g1_i1.p1 TRINITY_DN728_c0_g1~~TRINITY_DN728_c0_g1_i1.p1  ORF type:complete len:352 (-),score=73.48 TRINITY_DN728_c0_g1_i1:98-1153(-)